MDNRFFQQVGIHVGGFEELALYAGELGKLFAFDFIPKVFFGAKVVMNEAFGDIGFPGNCAHGRGRKSQFDKNLLRRFNNCVAGGLGIVVSCGAHYLPPYH